MPAGNKHPCGGNPTVATNIQSTIRLRKSQTVSRLFGADGLLLFIPEHIENLNENPENRNEPENFLKYMYHLPEIESPRVIPASFRYSREVRRPSFTVSCLQFESWKALGFHSSYYTKFAAISQRIALYFEAFREILQRHKRGRHPHDEALLFSRQARSSHRSSLTIGQQASPTLPTQRSTQPRAQAAAPQHHTQSVLSALRVHRKAPNGYSSHKDVLIHSAPPFAASEAPWYNTSTGRASAGQGSPL